MSKAILKLIKKDFVLEKEFFILIAILGLPFYLLAISSSGFLAFIFIDVYATIAIRNFFTNDEANNNLRLLATFPIHRRVLVFSRYIISMLILLISILFSWGIYHIYKFFQSSFQDNKFLQSCFGDKYSIVHFHEKFFYNIFIYNNM